MNYVIAVFSSRSEAMSFAGILKRMGVPVSLVSTPKEAGRTCGISARFSYDFFEYGKSALSYTRFTSFQGFFIQQSIGGRQTIVRG